MPKKQCAKEAITQIQEKLGGEYVVLGKYVTNITKIEVFHKRCQKSYFPTPKDIKGGKSSCSHCNGSDVKLGIERLSAEVRDKFLFPVDITSKKSKDRIEVQCRRCSHSFSTDIYKISKGRGCANCNGTKRMSHSEFLIKFSKVRFMDYTEYSFLTEYNGLERDITLKHLKCGGNFTTKPEYLLRKSKSCPMCFSTSIGVRALTTISSLMKLVYVTEYEFENLAKRRFDFFFPDLNLLIEYDGEQHFLNLETTASSNRHMRNSVDAIFRDWEKNNYVREYATSVHFLRINKNHLNVDALVQLFEEIGSGIAVPTVVLQFGAYYSFNGKVYNEESYYTNMQPNYFKQIESIL